jgi:alpha-tubulin suppressor-like RCC1 family protein
MNFKITTVIPAMLLIAGMAVLSNCALPTQEGAPASTAALQRAVGPGSQVVQVAAGNDFSMAIIKDSKGNQTLWVIGRNNLGQLGVNNGKTSRTWKNSGLKKVTLVACGLFHAMCVADNRLYVTGSNDNKQLGVNSPKGKSYIDKWTKTIYGDITALACGYTHSLFVSRGCLWVAGSNSCGQLGLGSSSGTYWLQTQTNAVSQIACGEYHSLYVGDNNISLYVTGRNGTGQLGLGYTSEEVVNWTKAPNIYAWGITAVSAGRHHSIIKAYGPLLSNPGIVSDWIWVTGDNYYKQLGLPLSTSKITSWCQLPYGNIGLIACGSDHSMFTSGGHLWVAGYNNSGQLGVGISGGLYEWQQTIYGNIYNGIAGGRAHNLFISQGQTWGAGSNSYGELGVEGFKKIQSLWFLEN